MAPYKGDHGKLCEYHPCKAIIFIDVSSKDDVVFRVVRSDSKINWLETILSLCVEAMAINVVQINLWNPEQQAKMIPEPITLY